MFCTQRKPIALLIDHIEIWPAKAESGIKGLNLAYELQTSAHCPTLVARQDYDLSAIRNMAYQKLNRYRLE